jgi:hypothetical protein
MGYFNFVLKLLEFSTFAMIYYCSFKKFWELDLFPTSIENMSVLQSV